ncbi:OsmC family protein [Echinicola jeungdonensis]|uniref:OsmC family protein n=1 Tax=Echinicola jeungdonensis TaxID=709343 RepID=A0ABV5J8Y7_9BACT|nr:OsmC family protein [Echinicola jeungdonensis]MDN3670199.1 OsmC family protein [Echinicola jeungdonensis]
MAKRNVTVTMKDDYEYESVNPSGNKVSIDMYDPDKKQHQSPMDLVLSAVASCASVDAVLMMKKKRKTVSGFTVEAEGDRDEGIPAYYKNIHMKFILTSPDATEKEFAKVIKLAVDKYCSVSASLNAEITYSSEVKKEA